jgi:hypothetical protein
MVICIQVLPLKQTITWLLRNQITEEVLHGSEEGKSSRAADDVLKHFLPSGAQGTIELPAPVSVASRVLSEAVKGRHADDILTPPPNA